MLSKEEAPVTPDGDGTDLPISCAPGPCQKKKKMKKKKAILLKKLSIIMRGYFKNPITVKYNCAKRHSKMSCNFFESEK